MEMYTVYVMRSTSNGRRYIGSTNNLARRVKEHESGQSRYTRMTGPYKLIYIEQYKTLIEARRRERFLKSGKGRECLGKIGK